MLGGEPGTTEDWRSQMGDLFTFFHLIASSLQEITVGPAPVLGRKYLASFLLGR